MSAETWNLIFIIVIAILGCIDIFGMVISVRMYKENRWCRSKIHKLITGDNVEMSIETLSIYYHIDSERLEALLNEQSTRG